LPTHISTELASHPIAIGTAAAAGLVGVIVLLQLLPARGVVVGPNPWRPAPGKRPLVIAHGGGQGLHPANTLVAFEQSVALGCDALEMDLRLTKDGVLVTHHDETIDRTSDGSGRVMDYTLAELKERNFGAKFRSPSGTRPYRDQPARLATVAELFQRFPGVPMILELKDHGAAGAQAAATLAQLIEREQKFTTVIVASFHDKTLEEFRRRSAGRVFTSTAVKRTRSYVLLNKCWLDWLAPTGDQAMQLPVAAAGLRLDTPRLIQAAHRRNMAVHYWTINAPAEMKRLIQMGADGVITDRPDLMLGVLAELGR
jgi:glycerophosphoryl diester phosphodiesterase